jgi:N-acetylmuramoyl-L-alanine amidase
MLILHYTGMPCCAAARARLCAAESEVSAHYLVSEDGDVAQCVPERLRAWHAGVSSWEGLEDINSRSLGIEISNPGHEHGYVEFPARQIDAVIALCRDILARRPIAPHRVLAHSDIAPARKQDPGEKFPWPQLHRAGIGLWVAPVPVERAGDALRPGDAGAAVARLQAALRRYGYGIDETRRYDTATEQVVSAFQRHFRPARVDGTADASTRETLDALLRARGLAASV